MKDAFTLGINGLFLRKPGTGIGQVTKHFLETLSKQEGDSFTCKVYVDEPFLNSSFRQGVEVTYIRPWWKRDDLVRKLLWEHIQLPKKALADNVTHFLSLYQAPTEFPRTVRHIMIVHDVIPEIFPVYLPRFRNHWVWKLTTRAICKASAIVAVSQSTKRDIQKYFGVPEERIQVGYPSIDATFWQENNALARDRVLEKHDLTSGYLYHGGGLEIRKNTESILTAYAAWCASENEKESIPPLVISGTIHSASNTLATPVKELIEKLNLQERVVLLGFVPEEDLPALYQEASLFLFPSLYEGFGMPVVEALSQGTAVLALKNSSLPEIGGEVVFWADEITKETLEKSYKRALQSTQEEQEIRKTQARNFRSWESFVQKVQETLVQ